VVCLLGIADRYMATALKSKCLSFLSQHAQLTKCEIFKELPQTLQVSFSEQPCLSIIANWSVTLLARGYGFDSLVWTSIGAVERSRVQAAQQLAAQPEESFEAALAIPQVLALLYVTPTKRHWTHECQLLVIILEDFAIQTDNIVSKEGEHGIWGRWQPWV